MDTMKIPWRKPSTGAAKAYEPTVFHTTDLARFNRTPESFAYQIDEIWVEMVVDTYYADTADAIGDPQEWADDTQYTIRVTHDGVSTETAPAEI
jgi:hypothetical protein